MKKLFFVFQKDHQRSSEHEPSVSLMLVCICTHGHVKNMKNISPGKIQEREKTITADYFIFFLSRWVSVCVRLFEVHHVVW